MEQILLEVFSSQSNSAIVRMPGRKFPGVVLQGDTLSGLYEVANKLTEELEKQKSALAEEAQEIRDDLRRHLDHYESVLSAHGISLPYPK